MRRRVCFALLLAIFSCNSTHDRASPSVRTVLGDGIAKFVDGELQLSCSQKADGFSDEVVAFIRQAPARRIEFHGYRVTREHLKGLIGLDALEEVCFITTFLADDALEGLESLKQVKRLRVCLSLDLTSRGLRQISKMGNLESLSVNEVSSDGQGWLDDLRGLEKLKSIDLARMHLTDQGATPLSGMAHLTDLDLSETSITDVTLKLLRKTSTLRRLNVNDTKVTPLGVRGFREARPDVEVWFDGHIQGK